jgi:hypothetical protein
MGFNDQSEDRSRRRQRPHSSLSKTPYLGVDALQGVPIRCQFCSSQSFRRSTLRAEDFSQLFLMRYPVRCLRCSQRQGVSFTIAGISLSSKIKPKRPGRNTPIPGAWNEPTEHAASPDPQEN